MNLPKAIEILTLMGTPEFDGHTEDILAARRLGIEALKRVQKMRTYKPTPPGIPLPSETKDYSDPFAGARQPKPETKKGG